MRAYGLYLLDLDGTVYRGTEPTPHAAAVLAALRERGAAIRFLTNNSAATPAGVAQKLQTMGILCDDSEVVTSGHAAASVLEEDGRRRLYIVGEPTLAEVLGSSFEVTNRLGGVLGAEGGQADAVLVGICRSFTYAWLDAALQQIRSGAGFYATNRDATYPLEGGRLQPGAGSIVAAVATAAGVEPITCGKPSPRMVEVALRSCSVRREDALVVGDRLDTDILCGEQAGCDTHLVLCGVTTEAPEAISSSLDLRGLL